MLYKARKNNNLMFLKGKDGHWPSDVVDFLPGNEGGILFGILSHRKEWGIITLYSKEYDVKCTFFDDFLSRDFDIVPLDYNKFWTKFNETPVQ